MAIRRLTKFQRQTYKKTSYMQPYKGRTVVKLADIATPALGQALNGIAHKEMDMKTAWAVSKLMEDRQNHIKTLESTRKVLLDKYCDKDEAGHFKINESKTQYLIADEVAYNREYEELTSVEVECTKLEEAMLEKLGSISPAQLLALKPFLA